MNIDRERPLDGSADDENEVSPYLALDRLLRYARHEAILQRREKAATLIEAAIISLPDTGTALKQ
jgi:hypothetical protein